MKNKIQKLLNRAERGQAIILMAFAMVGLIAMTGLVTDTGMLLINYGQLKRSVDAAAVSAAQQYRLEGTTLNQAALENAAINFLQLNNTQGVKDIIVHSCENVDPDRPALCNPDPVNFPNDNRKLVEVTASADVRFGFLSVIGIRSTTLTASAIGEAATIDLVLVIDTSASMAFETGSETADSLDESDSDDDPSVCNIADNCQPMRAVKDVALDFIDTLYFPYDRVSIVVMTSQVPNGVRTPQEIIPLTATKSTVVTAINEINVFEPRDCEPVDPDVIDTTDIEGLCLRYEGTTFKETLCEIYERHNTEWFADPSSCPSSNIGGTLKLAALALQGSGNANNQRLDAFWVVVALIGGPANATDTDSSYPNGYCPKNTFLLEYSQGPWCRDRFPGQYHSASAQVLYDNPATGSDIPAWISIYDADDYAHDMADELATLITGEGVTIFTIGLGDLVTKTTSSSNGLPPGATLLQYIAEQAGGTSINHGQYFYAPDGASLSNIFERIANNIATKISQ